MRSFDLRQTAILHFFTTTTIIIITSVSSAPANTIPYQIPHLTSLNQTTHPAPSSTLTIWPTLPWWTKLRNSNLDIIAIDDHAASPQQSYILRELVLLPLAQQIHQGAGPANITEIIGDSGVGAEFVPVEGTAPSREVVATAVVALAMAEWDFGARAVRAGVRVGEVRVGGLRVWVGGVEGEGSVV